MHTDSIAAHDLFWEDLVPGSEWVSGPHVVDRDELVAFARVWDPLPFHVDELAGHEAFGSITAPGLYMLAIKQRLIHTLPQHQIIGSVGYDEVRFHLPMRPGDTVYLRETCKERRVEVKTGPRHRHPQVLSHQPGRGSGHEPSGHDPGSPQVRPKAVNGQPMAIDNLDLTC